jgi:large subunit ribosomal protein L5
MQRLKEKFISEVVPKLMEEFDIDNKLAVPKITKITLNMGIGDTLKSKDLLEAAKKDLSIISGQAPSIRAAKVSVASFAIRRGMSVGLKVTLRGQKMWAFLDRLFSIVLPRFRDFRGVSLKSFDKFGNYTLGITEQIVFPEIDYAKSHARGLEVTISTDAKDAKVSQRMLELLGMPFEKISEENKGQSAKVKK